VVWQIRIRWARPGQSLKTDEHEQVVHTPAEFHPLLRAARRDADVRIRSRAAEGVVKDAVWTRRR
jgi:hypothetical protein